MFIAIAGNGKLGSALAESLSHEGHDVVVIDNDDEAIARTETMDVQSLRGNAGSISVLEEAGVGEADALIATTQSDEVNMICCMIAKRLGAKYTIARVREMEYSRDFDQFRATMGIDRILNPDHYTANTIARLLRFPSAQNIESFARGRVDMVGFTAKEHDPLCGTPLMHQKKLLRELLVCVVEREDAAFIPKGDFVILPGDRVHVLGDANALIRFFKEIGRYNPKSKDIMIVGASRIAFYLSGLALEGGMSVCVIEKNAERCKALVERFPAVIALKGDGTDMETLESEGLPNMSAFVALTDHDEDNLVTSIYAAKRGVPKVITKINHITYMHLLGDLGLDSIISPREIMVSQILRVVRGLVNAHDSESIETLHRILEGRIEAAQFDVPSDFGYISIPVKDLPIRQGILIAAILRGNRVLIPSGVDSLHLRDSVIVVAQSETLRSLGDVFL